MWLSVFCILQENRLRAERIATAGYNDVLILNQDLFSKKKSQYRILALGIHGTRVFEHVTYLDSG